MDGLFELASDPGSSVVVHRYESKGISYARCRRFSGRGIGYHGTPWALMLSLHVMDIESESCRIGVFVVFDGLLEGTSKFMRHVKLRPEGGVDAGALKKLIETAYADMKGRLKAA
jgi:hypothetical protein